jgi:hypothetical protein
MSRDRKPTSPFRYFNSSPEVIRLVVMMYVRFPLSLRNVEVRGLVPASLHDIVIAPAPLPQSGRAKSAPCASAAMWRRNTGYGAVITLADA